MSADASTLPIRDFLDIGLSLAGVQTLRSPKPLFQVFFRLHMHNSGGTSVRLLGRKWILQDDSGDTRIIEARGVFNQTPILSPGSVFSYSGRQTFQRRPILIELRFFGTDQYAEPFITPAIKFPRKCFRLPMR